MDKQTTRTSSQSSEEEEPWSEVNAVRRTKSDRDEIYDLLKGYPNDLRVRRFLEEYDLNYKSLIVIHDSRLKRREQVRLLKAKRCVSTARYDVVNSIYDPGDDHISDLRREMNQVYQQLIEVQEADAETKTTISTLINDIKELLIRIKEREKHIPTQQIHLKEKLENKLNELRGDRDKMNWELEKIREAVNETNHQITAQEEDRRRIELRIAETMDDDIRIESLISKENSRRNDALAVLTAATARYEARKQDMADTLKLLEQNEQKCKNILQQKRFTNITVEKLSMECGTLINKLRLKKYEVERHFSAVNDMEAEVESRKMQLESREQEVTTLKTNCHTVDHVRRGLRSKLHDLDSRKEEVLKAKEKKRVKNQKFACLIESSKRNFEEAIKGQTTLRKRRDGLRKTLMKQKSQQEKDRMLVSLHQLANRRLMQDNQGLSAKGVEQHKLSRKLELERDKYHKQYIDMTKKFLKTTEEEKKWMDSMLHLMRTISEEEMKIIESQNMYEATRNEHVIYTRHILQVKDQIQRLKAKVTAMTYETQKYIQERNYRDECMVMESLATNKLNKHIAILRNELADIKETNARHKLIVENEDIEEKKLLKMTRIMRVEMARESTVLKRVIKDTDGLDLALIRRHHELRDLYKTVKLKQSLLEKGENMYNIRWKEVQVLAAKLTKTQGLRRLEQKKIDIIRKLENCVKFFEGQLERVHLRSKGLSEELKHPRNIHRWRSLLGRDPDAYTSVRLMHKVRHKIQMTEHVSNMTMAKIHDLDAEYIALTAMVASQPSPETVMQLKIYKEDLNTKYMQIKTLTKELQGFLEESKESKETQKAIGTKLRQIRFMWFEHKALERARMQRDKCVTNPLGMLRGPAGPLPDYLAGIDKAQQQHHHNK